VAASRSSENASAIVDFRRAATRKRRSAAISACLGPRYRKALRIMKLAEKFQRPVLSFIDTQGAYPGLDSEERGVAEAIARNLLEMSQLRVPIIATVIGEGGSGGALGIGVADTVLMLEHSVYSVISPEGCAAILWKDQARAQEAAEAMRVTAADCKAPRRADRVVAEPGRRSRGPVATIDNVGRALRVHLDRLAPMPVDALLEEPLQQVPQDGRLRVSPATSPRRPSPRPGSPSPSSLHDAGLRRLTSDLSLPAAAARVLSARGISSVAEARGFLDPQDGVLHDPFRLGGVPRPPRSSSRRVNAAAASSCSATTTATASGPSRFSRPF
jgi:hypothetical protein